MRKIIMSCFLIAFISFSCTNENNNAQYQAVLQSLNSSNLFIENNNKNIYGSLDSKLVDPQTRAKAELWQPKAKALNKIFDSAVLYINLIRVELKKLAGLTTKDEKEIINIDDRGSVEQLFFKENKAKELANKIRSLKNGIIDVLTLDDFVDYPTFRQNFQLQVEGLIKEWPINLEISAGADSITTSNNFYSDYFKNTNVLGAMVMLAKIQNDILKSEHLILDLINNQTAYHEHLYDRAYAIFAQNTTVLNSGQEIEITAGIGFFNAAVKPTFTINGQVTTMCEDGVAVYKLSVKQTPGKYTIPVKAEYTKPDGSSVIMTKKIEYQVVQ